MLRWKGGGGGYSCAGCLLVVQDIGVGTAKLQLFYGVSVVLVHNIVKRHVQGVNILLTGRW